MCFFNIFAEICNCIVMENEKINSEFPCQIACSKEEIRGFQLSKQEVKTRLEVILSKYPDSVIFERVNFIGSLGVLTGKN